MSMTPFETDWEDNFPHFLTHWGEIIEIRFLRSIDREWREREINIFPVFLLAWTGAMCRIRHISALQTEKTQKNLIRHSISKFWQSPFHGSPCLEKWYVSHTTHVTSPNNKDIEKKKCNSKSNIEILKISFSWISLCGEMICLTYHTYHLPKQGKPWEEGGKSILFLVIFSCSFQFTKHPTQAWNKKRL